MLCPSLRRAHNSLRTRVEELKTVWTDFTYLPICLAEYLGSWIQRRGFRTSCTTSYTRYGYKHGRRSAPDVALRQPCHWDKRTPVSPLFHEMDALDVAPDVASGVIQNNDL